MSRSSNSSVETLLGDLPSYNPQNFSQLRPFDPHRSHFIPPVTYHATHDRTLPPADQVISTEVTNILLRQFYQRPEQKRLRMKRSASIAPDHASKHLKPSAEAE